MTIEQAIGMSAAELEAMTDEDLKKHFDHYLLVSRPENTVRAVKQEQRTLAIDPQFAKAKALAATMGIVLPTFKPLKRK